MRRKVMRHQGLAVWLLGLCLLLGGLLGPHALVQAADVTPRTIIVHKYSGTPAMADQGTIPSLSDVPADSYPLSGITFTATKVSLVNGKTLDPQDPSTYTKAATAAATATTGLDGVAKLTVGTGTAADGTYLVTESGGDGLPFFIQFPFNLGDDANTAEVYPKNTVTDADDYKVQKYVSNTLDQLGGDQTDVTTDAAGHAYAYWTLEMTRPLDLHGAQIKTAGTVQDQEINGAVVKQDTTVYQDYGSLQFHDSISDAQVVKLALVVKDVNGTDQTIPLPLSDIEADGTYYKSTPALVQAMSQYAANTTRVRLTLRTDMTASSASNSFQGYYAKPDGTPAHPDNQWLGSNTVTAYRPQLTINKTDESGTKKLAHAVFKIYPTKADAEADTNALSFNGSDTLETDANGQIVASGFQLDANQSGTFYVVEVDAPMGYDVDDEIHAVTFTKSALAATVTVADHDNLLPNLPLTGSQARLWAAVLGALLLGLGAWLGIRQIKRLRD